MIAKSVYHASDGIDPTNWLNTTLPSAPAPQQMPITLATFLIGKVSASTTGSV